MKDRFNRPMSQTSGRCALCGNEPPHLAASIGICGPCLREKPDQALPLVRQMHGKLREDEELPAAPPRSRDGIPCKICRHECVMGPGEKGYCGVRWVERGRMRGADADWGSLSYYLDPLPTNCVADWVCPGGTEAGYPEYSTSAGPEFGCNNLAVFYHGCSFDCLFCQNSQHRSGARSSQRVSAQELADSVDERTTCVCFFGGDPAPQGVHALRSARLAMAKAEGRPMRICWETNGSESPALLRSMLRISLSSGGVLKMDFKAWDRTVHEALCGVGPEWTRQAVAEGARWARKRPAPPLLVVSSLLVPGYVDDEEIRGIAGFLSSLDPEIPYALLAFHPQFHMRDLPPTSREHAERCLQAARDAGLRRVRLGNTHLLF